MVPASPTDAKGLLRSAVDIDDPVMSFEACLLWSMKEDMQDGEFKIPFGVARTVRAGTDVTIVAISTAVPAAMQAAQKLEAEGISVEIIDPRTLVPFDSQAVLNSVARTGRLVVADPANRTCGAAAEISAIVAEQAFDSLKTAIVRVTTPDTHVPFNPAIEKQLYPNATAIADAVRKVINGKRG
jgi:pyruvate dehydrogenase E1 component beta subunit